MRDERHLPNSCMLTGAGSDIAVHIGADGVVVVDAGLAGRAGPPIAEVNEEYFVKK